MVKFYVNNSHHEDLLAQDAIPIDCLPLLLQKSIQKRARTERDMSTSTTTDKTRTRRVLAVRHGQSTWNVLKARFPSEQERFQEPVMYTPDAPITELGVSQSRQAGRNLSKALLLNNNDDETTTGAASYVMIVSPLRRALQTARHMLSTVSHRPLASPMVHAAATEIMADACDIGSPVADLQAEFGNDFDFSNMTSNQKEESIYWWPFHQSLKETWRRMKNRLDGGCETEEMVQGRIELLKQVIVQYLKSHDASAAEVVVVVVCHSDLIYSLTRHVNQNGQVVGWDSDNGEILDITRFVL